jgi:hypothetical protein
MYAKVEQFETKERRVARELQLLEELGETRRSAGRPRRRRMFALRAPRPRRVGEAGCLAEPECC